MPRRVRMPPRQFLFNFSLPPDGPAYVPFRRLLPEVSSKSGRDVLFCVPTSNDFQVLYRRIIYAGFGARSPVIPDRNREGSYRPLHHTPTSLEIGHKLTTAKLLPSTGAQGSGDRWINH